MFQGGSVHQCATRGPVRRRTQFTGGLRLAALLVAPVLAAGCAGVAPQPPVTSGADLSDLAARSLETLQTLPVKGRAPKAGYDRALFGEAWTDQVTVEGGGNGCDTRNDILQRDLSDIELRDGSDCVVVAGILNDPYTGRQIYFERGVESSAAVQIDHVVALSDAWQKGAQQLDEQDRRNLANDPLNLQAADGPTNQAKGDKDAASWLPPNRSYRCTYVARQIDVKARYGLWVTQAEKDAMAQTLQGCVKPAGGSAPAGATSQQAPQEAPQPYVSCDQARAAGDAPLYRGNPRYTSKLDGDGDGVACE